MSVDIQNVKAYLLNFQQQVCDMLEQQEPSARFISDQWQHQNGSGGGDTRVMQNGQLIEQGGVNFSHITAASLPPAATVKRPELANQAFQAMGVSLVIHPLNPYIPTTHANLRFFVTEDKTGKATWWCGGGFDLTPYYGFVEDCVLWHEEAQAACESFGADVYPLYKKACDDYFFLRHRHEARGVGGLFFDDLNEWGFDQSFAFVQSVGEHFIKAYRTIVQRRKALSYGERERNFQLYRRGRYVEFNLLYDRGTLFGLQSGGRTESILMSLPPHVDWRYNWQPEAGSEEARLYTDFLPARDWLPAQDSK